MHTSRRSSSHFCHENSTFCTLFHLSAAPHLVQFSPSCIFIRGGGSESWKFHRDYRRRSKLLLSILLSSVYVVYDDSSSPHPIVGNLIERILIKASLEPYGNALILSTSCGPHADAFLSCFPIQFFKWCKKATLSSYECVCVCVSLFFFEVFWFHSAFYTYISTTPTER